MTKDLTPIVAAKEIVDNIKLFFTRTSEIVDSILLRSLQIVDVNGYQFVKDKLDKLPDILENVNVITDSKQSIYLNFDIFDNFYNLTSDIAKVLSIVTNNKTLDHARMTMSLSYFNELSNKVSNIKFIHKKISSLVNNLITLIVDETDFNQSENNLDALYSEFSKTIRSHYSYLLLIEILVKLSKMDIDVDKFVELIKNNIFDVNDSPSKIAEDIKSRSNFHPIQAMGLTFGLVPYSSATDKIAFDGEAANNLNINDNKIVSSSEVPSSIIAIDKTLPGKAVIYDLDALLTPTSENSSYGINHKIIERLNTIREVSKKPYSNTPKIQIPDEGVKNIIQTIDGGLTFKECGTKNPNLFRNIGAGPKLRLDEINRHISIIVQSNVNDNTNLLAEYEKFSESFKFPFINRLAKNLIHSSSDIGEEKKSNVKKSNIDKIVFSALSVTLRDYWLEFITGKITGFDIDRESSIWIAWLTFTLSPKISRSLKNIGNRRNKIETLEPILEEIIDPIPTIPFKLYSMLQKLQIYGS